MKVALDVWWADVKCAIKDCLKTIFNIKTLMCKISFSFIDFDLFLQNQKIRATNRQPFKTHLGKP